MSTDNPKQLLTTRDLSQLRGHLQSGPAAVTSTAVTASGTAAVVAAAAVANAPHGYRNIAPLATISCGSSASTNSTNSTTSTAAGAAVGGLVPTSNSNMPASASKYVFVQHNHNGGFTAYDGSTTAVTAAATASTTGNSGHPSSSGGGGNIVLLAAEPLEMGSADALAVATAAAAAAGVRTTDGDDVELRSLSWLNDSNLIKGIVTSSGAGGAAGAVAPGTQVKRAMAIKAGGGGGGAAAGAGAGASVNGNMCIVSDLIEEVPSSLNEPSGGDQDGGGSLYSTTTVHKGPSGTTTVVEYKASKAGQQQAYLSTPTRATALGYMPVVVTTQPQPQQQPQAAVSQAILSPMKQTQSQPQSQSQIYVTSNGGALATGNGIFKGASLCSPTTSSSSSSNTTTHHPHKKYLREKMLVQMDHSSHVASTVTVVSSPASSNNSSISSSSLSGGGGSVSSTAAVNGGNSPVAKAGSSSNSFSSAVFEAVNYASANVNANAATATATSSSSSSSSSSHNQEPPPPTAVVAASTLISAGSLAPGYSYVSTTPHVISTPGHVTSPETPSGAAGLLPGTYYSSSSSSSGGGAAAANLNLQPHTLQLASSPPPPTTSHVNGSLGGGGGGASAAGVNLRSPNSYTSYDNEDSLKDFDLVISSRMHTSTPQYAVSKGGYGSVNGAGAGAAAGGATTPQKQKHPNNVPYDPLVHTNNKPPYSFSSLIFMAIESSNEKALPVKEIYAWIVQHFPYFKTAPTGWKNSVRHNLSLNKSFVKVEKAPNMGKGSLWRVEPQQRQNLIQALNRSPFFPNSAVDKISPSLKSPKESAYDSLDGSVSSGMPVSGAPAAPAAGSGPGAAAVPAAVSLSTPSKSNGLALANGASQVTTNAARPHSPNGGGGGGGGSGSHARFDPKLFPNLCNLFGNIRDDLAGQPQSLREDDLSDDYHSTNISTSNNNHSSNSSKYNYAGLNAGTGTAGDRTATGTGTGGPALNGGGAGGAGAGGGGGGGPAPPPSDGINFEQMARECGADSMDDVHAAAALLCLKHEPKAFSSDSFQNGSAAPVITSSPSEDHTYSAGGNSNADSGSSTPVTNGNGLATSGVAAQGAGSDSNCASSDAAYDSSEENHNITPAELDEQRYRDGVDALLSLSRSSNVDYGSHYHSNGSSGSSQGSPRKRPASQSLEEEQQQQQQHHREQQHHQQQQQQQHRDQQFGSLQAIYTNGSGSKMALLSSAAANVALAQQQQQQHQPQHQHQQQQQQQQHQQQLHPELYSYPAGMYLGNLNHCLPAGGVGATVGGNSSISNSSSSNSSNTGMLPQHLSAAMAVAAAAAAAAASKNKVKPLRGLRTKIKRKSAWMR